MLPKISFKKLMFLSLGLLIIGALTNCGGSSGGGGGSGGANPANKKAPVKPTCSISDQLDIKVSINGADEECLLKDKKTLDFVLNSIAEPGSTTRTWDNSDVTVALLQISEDATAKLGCANASGQSVEQGWVLDFSSNDSCEITVSLKNDSNTQVVYTLNMVGYGISEAADFKIPFFASAAASFVLTKDITLKEETKSLATNFKGQLDGLGHTIKGLSIDARNNADSSDNIGLISLIELKPGDATVEIKNLTLGITKLVGQDNVGGLIGKVESGDGANAVQIKNVTVEFTDSAELTCTSNCGGLVGYASTAVHFSGIVVKGDVSAAGSYLGGVVGGAVSAAQLTDVTAHFNMNHSGFGEGIGLVAGWVQGNSTLSKIDAAGVITCTGGCGSVGGVVGSLTGGSQLSQVKSSLQLTTSSNAQNVGGVVGQFYDSMLTAVYGKLTADVDGGDAINFGSVIGDMQQEVSLEKAVGYLDLSASGSITAGSLIGNMYFSQNTTGSISQVFAAGSANGTIAKAGQMIGPIMNGKLTASNCYSGAFTGNTIPDEAVGDINDGASASFTKCYTRAPNFVRAADLSQVTFNTVYATTPQTDSLGVTSETLPDPFEASILNGGDGSTIWTNEYDNEEYKYPMLAYPKEDMGLVSEADWFEFQIKDNEKK